MEAAPLRKNDILASNLLFAYLIITYVWAAVDKFLLHRVSLLEAGTKAVIITVLVMAGIAYFVRKGKLWAKILFLVVFAVQIIGPVMDYVRVGPRFQSEPVIVFLNYAISYVMQGWAVVLMFKKPRLQEAS